MKTTYVYCKICKKVHEKPAEPVFSFDLCECSDPFKPMMVLDDIRRIEAEIFKSFAIPLEYFKK